jgi:2-dehydro-3-deoxyphosphogluconate aldolase/(4S)-4-hydroxy-2-oxoglutarate aldolase
MDTMELAGFGPVIPVIIIERAEDGVPLAEALLAGGVRVLEVTLRTPAALGAIEAIAKALPEAIVGAGTVRTPGDARAALAAGSQFAVSPGLTPSLAKACREIGLPLLPGTATASEVMLAQEEGFRFVKLFPAVSVGGVGLLKALASPFRDVSFCPTGGITAETAPSFLALPNVKVCGGSWLTPADAIARREWSTITRLAREAQSLRTGAN